MIESWKGWVTECAGLVVSLALVWVTRGILLNTEATGRASRPELAAADPRNLVHLLDEMVQARENAANEARAESRPAQSEAAEPRDQSEPAAPGDGETARAMPEASTLPARQAAADQGGAGTAGSLSATTEGGQEVRYYVRSIGPQVATGIYRRIGPHTYEYFDPTTGRIRPTTQLPDLARHILISYRGGRGFGLPFDEGIICLSAEASGRAEELGRHYPVVVVEATGLEGVSDGL